MYYAFVLKRKNPKYLTQSYDKGPFTKKIHIKKAKQQDNND